MIRRLDSGWIRHYTGGDNGVFNALNPHTDDPKDEWSVVVQFHPGAFLFIFSEQDSAAFDEEWFDSVFLSDENNLPLIHMDAGDIVIYHGRKMYHGCRRLKPDERRLQLTLFYEIDGNTSDDTYMEL